MYYFLVTLFGLGLPLAYTQGPRWVSYYTKMAIFYLALLIVSSAFAPYFLLKSTSVKNMVIPANFMMKIASFLSLRISIKGIEKLDQLSNKCAVLVANHQFSLDLFGLFALWGLFEKLTIVSKASLKYLGPFGLAGIKSGVIFIDRKQGKLAHKIIRTSLEGMNKDGTKLMMFPEGTRNHNPESKEMLPFKSGAFRAAIAAQVPIVPIVFSHYNFLDCKAKKFDAANITIKILDPVETVNLKEEDFQILQHEVRSKMLREFCQDGL